MTMCYAYNIFTLGNKLNQYIVGSQQKRQRKMAIDKGAIPKPQDTNCTSDR